MHDGRAEFIAAVSEVGINSKTWRPASERWVESHYHSGGRLGFEESGKWDLDGVVWHEAPAPRARHKHFVQSYAFFGFEQVFRCPCGAIGGNMEREWVLLDPPRVAPQRLLPSGHPKSKSLDAAAALVVVALVVALVFWVLGWNGWGALIVAMLGTVWFRVLSLRARPSSGDRK